MKRLQRGSAVVLAMLVLAAATALITGTLWQQSALIRETENERAYAQARWLLRGAIDWAGVILREDARTSAVDHRAEPWAVPLADTRLNENDGRPAAYLAGAIDDEQAKFNLRNLLSGSDLNGNEVGALRRLLAALRIDERLADRIAERLLAAQKARASEPAAGLAYVDDLLQVGLTPEQVQRLKGFVTILPEPTQLNVNTASAEVLSARIPGLELTDARRIVSARDRAYFKDMGDALQRLRDVVPSVTDAGLAVTTRYFGVDGTVSYGPARLAAHALVRRDAATLEVLWMKEAS